MAHTFTADFLQASTTAGERFLHHVVCVKKREREKIIEENKPSAAAVASADNSCVNL